jgi:hypothetical protein
VKSSKRKKLDDDYKYVDEDEDNNDSAVRHTFTHTRAAHALAGPCWEGQGDGSCD